MSKVTPLRRPSPSKVPEYWPPLPLLFQSTVKRNTFSGQLTAAIRLSTTDNAARTPKTPVSFLDYVEHELKTVALRDRPLPIDVARHDRHSPS